MPNILITGGAGYIGSVTAHLLKRRGYGVVVVDNLSRGYEHNVSGLPFHDLHLSDTGSLAELLSRQCVDAVIHFGAYALVQESTNKPELYFLNNAGGSASLLSAMIHADVKRLVFSSTCAVYGTPTIVPIPEDLPFDPVNPYGESKALVEKMLKWLDSCCGLRSITLRYFNACGSDPESGLGEEHDPETHLIPLLIRAAVTGKPMTIFGDDYDTPDGTCIRDYVHVTDLAEAHVVAVEKLLAGGGSDVFNVGTGTGHSVLEVMRAVEQVTGRNVPHAVGPRRAGDPAFLVANSNKMKRTLGWKAKFPDLKDIIATAWQFENRQAATRRTEFIGMSKTDFAGSREKITSAYLARTREAVLSSSQPVTSPSMPPQQAVAPSKAPNLTRPPSVGISTIS